MPLLRKAALRESEAAQHRAELVAARRGHGDGGYTVLGALAAAGVIIGSGSFMLGLYSSGKVRYNERAAERVLITDVNKGDTRLTNALGDLVFGSGGTEVLNQKQLAVGSAINIIVSYNSDAAKIPTLHTNSVDISGDIMVIRAAAKDNFNALFTDRSRRQVEYLIALYTGLATTVYVLPYYFRKLKRAK